MNHIILDLQDENYLEFYESKEEILGAIVLLLFKVRHIYPEITDRSNSFIDKVIELMEK